MMSGVYSKLGPHTYDLEFYAKAFSQRLHRTRVFHRIRVLPLNEFNPDEFLD